MTSQYYSRDGGGRTTSGLATICTESLSIASRSVTFLLSDRREDIQFLV
jgi:hypothetical protein